MRSWVDLLVNELVKDDLLLHEPLIDHGWVDLLVNGGSTDWFKDDFID